MQSLIEILFKGGRKEIYQNPMQFPFKLGDYAIVEADKGEDLGMVHQYGALLNRKKSNNEPLNILRKPSTEDLTNLSENRQKEKQAFLVCREKIKKHQLNMKLVDVEYQFDGNKITFYFTSDQRVDFRELVKDLASEYRVRIELRQIGVRDEARRLGGYGICGCEICCTTFLNDFEPITTQCAKEQNLPLNPQKLSGICGRLRCCLRYEHDFYHEFAEHFPNINSEIRTPKGTGTITWIDIFSQQLELTYQNDEIERISFNDFKAILEQSKPIEIKSNDSL